MLKYTLLLSLLFLCSCGDGEKPTPPTGNPYTPTAPKGQFVRAHPAYDVQLATGEGDANPSVVTWTAKVPTTGWKMTTINVLIETTNNKWAARIEVIIEQPGPDEAVTAGEQTLIGEYKDKHKIERVELSSRVVVRGVDDVKRAMLSVVKTFKYPYD
jgi:hypothetical protein